MMRRDTLVALAAAMVLAGCGILEKSQTPGSVEKAAGDAQTGAAGEALPAPVQVRVLDTKGEPISGAEVTFTITGGGGSVASGTVMTDGTGRAQTSWTVGTTAGAPQALKAQAGAASTSFSASVTAAAAGKISVSAGNNQIGGPSQTLNDSLEVLVTDAFDNPVAGHTVAWSVTSGGGAVSPASSVTDTDGHARASWTLGSSLGQQTAEGASAGLSGSPAGFTANSVSGTMAVVEGDGQTGLVGFGVNVAPAVKVTATGGSPIPGVTVTFAVAGGGGSVQGAVQLTDAQGVARVGKWVLGATAGSNSLTATASGGTFSGNPTTFTAMGATAQYNIEVRPLTTLTTAQQQAFDNAAARWQQLIFGDLPDVAVTIAADKCGAPGFMHPAVNETIDDVVIFARVEPIDNAGGTLANAGPCVLRMQGKLTALGIMRLDDADLPALEANGQLGDVILHEMGHVLGVGTLWPVLGLLQDSTPSGQPPNDTYFSGPQAQRAFDDVGGTSYTGGRTVPVENTGGDGTRNGHWRESAMDEELMTGFVEPPGTANPLSRVTVAQFWDLGYQVNLDGSDAYNHVFTVAPAAAPLTAGRLLLLNDVSGGPIYVIDQTGGIRRVRE